MQNAIESTIPPHAVAGGASTAERCGHATEAEVERPRLTGQASGEPSSLIS